MPTAPSRTFAQPVVLAIQRRWTPRTTGIGMVFRSVITTTTATLTSTLPKVRKVKREARSNGISSFTVMATGRLLMSVTSQESLPTAIEGGKVFGSTTTTTAF